MNNGFDGGCRAIMLGMKAILRKKKKKQKKKKNTKKKNHHFDVHEYQKGVVWQFSDFLDIQVKIRFSFSS